MLLPYLPSSVNVNSLKIMKFYPVALSVNENSEQESNPMLYLLYLHLSRPAFLVSFTDPNKQLLNVKSVFRSPNHVFSM